eukprot:806478-Prorocentrum_minimum.AAC.3
MMGTYGGLCAVGASGHHACKPFGRCTHKTRYGGDRELLEVLKEIAEEIAYRAFGSTPHWANRFNNKSIPLRHILSSLPRLVSSPGIISLHFTGPSVPISKGALNTPETLRANWCKNICCNWCPRWVYSLSPSVIGTCNGYIYVRLAGNWFHSRAVCTVQPRRLWTRVETRPVEGYMSHTSPSLRRSRCMVTDSITGSVDTFRCALSFSPVGSPLLQ